MGMKQILGIALAGAVSVGAVLGSGMPVYAAAEDWIRVDVDRNGNKQPSISPIDLGSGEVDWEMSYGYTIHPEYKYVLRICDENTREWGKSHNP